MMLHDFEIESSKKLHADLADFLNALPPSLFLIEHLIKTLKGKDARTVAPAHKVTAALFIRLANDLRLAGIAAAVGYHVQAATIVASIFETAFLIVRLVDDDTLAIEWSEFSEPTENFRKIYTLVREAITRFSPDVDEELIKQSYRRYRQLCLAKHGNPLFLRQHTFQFVDNTIDMTLGPSTISNAVRVSQLVLLEALGLTVFACAAFARHYGPNDKITRVSVRRLEEERQTLMTRFTNRWGGEDPFKGRW